MMFLMNDVLATLINKIFVIVHFPGGSDTVFPVNIFESNFQLGLNLKKS